MSGRQQGKKFTIESLRLAFALEVRFRDIGRDRAAFKNVVLDIQQR
jgi:hypothetical protein